MRRFCFQGCMMGVRIDVGKSMLSIGCVVRSCIFFFRAGFINPYFTVTIHSLVSCGLSSSTSITLTLYSPRSPRHKCRCSRPRSQHRLANYLTHPSHHKVPKLKPPVSISNPATPLQPQGPPCQANIAAARNRPGTAAHMNALSPRYAANP